MKSHGKQRLYTRAQDGCCELCAALRARAAVPPPPSRRGHQTGRTHSQLLRGHVRRDAQRADVSARGRVAQLRAHASIFSGRAMFSSSAALTGHQFAVSSAAFAPRRSRHCNASVRCKSVMTRAGLFDKIKEIIPSVRVKSVLCSSAPQRATRQPACRDVAAFV